MTNIESVLKATQSNRTTLAYILDKTPNEVLNRIPEGYNNNILWNAGHVVSISQLLIYSLSENRWKVDKEIVKRFRNETQAENYSDEDIDLVRNELVRSGEKLIDDYQNGLFTKFHEFDTLTKFKLQTVEDAINYNLYHEGYHMGIIQALIRK